MTCPNKTSPIDIVKNESNDCTYKCDFSFHYQYTSVSVINYGDYLEYKFNKQTNPVKFNNKYYNVDSMLIYQKSLHTYNNKKADAELLIIHNEQHTNEILIVCVPILKGKLNSSSPSELDILIDQTSQMANNINSSAKLTINNFTLNSLVPKKPFYYYVGTLPYIPCTKNIKYIVYDIKDSLNIQINSYDEQLTNIISENNIISIKDKTKKVSYSYNKDGPNKNILEDDIYIDCQPTGDNGDVLISKTISVPSVNNEIGKYLALGLLIIIVIIILYYVKKYFLSGILETLNLRNNSS